MPSCKQAVKFLRNLTSVLIGFMLLSCDQNLPVKQVNVVKNEVLPEIDRTILKRAIYTNRFQLDPHFAYSAQIVCLSGICLSG
ncbi:hypothetical protein NYR89_02025 [Actinobacillus arthritidis]|nr:hypothetical protein [Actinobacillus arthritidis]WGE89729.1 hypothetical protein NYR89_02025 [Actinobacillus arthritidis]